MPRAARSAPPPPRKADTVARDLMRRIVGGELATGTILPHEPALATRYGVNRSVVREAIKLLEVHRLVQPVRRRGTVVLDARASVSPEVLRAMLVPAPGQLDQHMLASVLDLRGLLDSEMWARAAVHRTAAELAAMKRALAACEAALGEPDAYFAGVDALALLAAKAAHNPLFEMLTHWHRAIVADLGAALLTMRVPSARHLEGLSALVGHVAAKRPEPARALIRSFHDWVTPRLLELATLAAPPEAPRTTARRKEKHR